MADKPSALNQIGPITGQMKQSFSTSERSQIAALRSISGTVSTNAGSVNSDITGRFVGIGNSTQGRLGIGATLAQSLEASGLTTDVVGHLLTSRVTPAVTHHRPLDRSSSFTPTDLSLAANRMPSLRQSSPTSVINDKRQSINNSPNNMFPTDLDTSAPTFIRLKFYKYHRANSFGTGNVSPVKEIVLPIPENFNQAFNVKYDQRDQGFLGDGIGIQAAAKGMFDAARTGDEAAAVEAREELRRTGAELAASFAARKSYAALDMINDIAPFKEVAGAAAGMIPNPHTTIFFQGMDLRTFQWTWKLVPRNKGDAAEIEAILKSIKEHALPTKKNMMLEYPHMLKPEIGGKVGSMFGEFRYSMIRGININFSGEGASAFFRDGRPVSIQLGIEFQEVDIALGGG